MGIIISVILAVIAHHLYEVNYLKWPPSMILLIVVTLMTTSVGLYYKLEKDEDPENGYPPDPVNYSAININDAAWNTSTSEFCFLHFSFLILCITESYERNRNIGLR